MGFPTSREVYATIGSGHQKVGEGGFPKQGFCFFAVAAIVTPQLSTCGNNRTSKITIFYNYSIDICYIFITLLEIVIIKLNTT